MIGICRARVKSKARAPPRHLANRTHAVLHAADFLERHEGYRVTRLPVDAGESSIRIFCEAN